MITRYTRPEMGEVWSQETRFQCMLDVELAVAIAQGDLGIIPEKAVTAIEKNAAFSVKRIDEIEKTTKHDVIAFVSNVAEVVGTHGRFVHYGMTSSDVLDTALSVQIKKAWPVLSSSFQRLMNALGVLIEDHRYTVCAGRTHGIHAEMTTFGMKMAGHLAEFMRARDRVERGIDTCQIAKISGAVGTYGTQPAEVEKRVAAYLGLKPEIVSTQVIPRDRHAELMWSLAVTGAAVERLCVELRHLQRTEVSEVIEDFAPGQKGSSAMPHKKNPISAENLTGVARLLRSYSDVALENVALWHERDISHSSVERVVFPDSFILCDYALDRLSYVLENLYVDKYRMEKNMELSKGKLFSSQVLLALITKGLSREDAYKIVQKVSMEVGDDETFQEKLAADSKVSKLLSKHDLKTIFSGERLRQQIDSIIDRVVVKKKGSHGRKR